MPTSKKSLQAQAIHDLICDILRGPHIRKMPGTDLALYTYQAGVALHNLPFALTGDHPLTLEHLRQINELDPNITSNEWGPWATKLANAFNINLPNP